MSIPLDQIFDSLTDGFTNEHLTIFAGPDGVGGAPHYYEVRDRFDKVKCQITLQEGHPEEVGVNGIGNQTLLLIVLHFLRKVNAGKFNCRENSLQITAVEEALLRSKQRELDRKMRGVLQTYDK